MKIKHLLMTMFVAILTLVGCSQGKEEVKETIKVGMVTDVAGVEDGSFSELTWKGVNKFANEHEGIKAQYVTPKDTNLSELTSNIDNLILAGNEVIVVAGFAFEEAIGESATKHKDVKFILIDGEPLINGNYVSLDNVISVKFKENEAGFLAGVVSALESKTGKVGYIGGIEVPAVVAYGIGFEYGVQYANEYLNTQTEVVDYIYSGTFEDFSLGQMLSAGMFDKGVDIIMVTAGVATQGAIAEAKQRNDVYIVGCDSDQYTDGIKEDGKSVVLTSAMKHIDVAVQDVLSQWLKGKFPSGETLIMDATVDGVGLPPMNDNVSDETLAKVEEVKLLMQEGKINIPCE